MAKGKSRQEARGHKPGEAARRRAREVEEQGVAGSNIRSITHWYETQFNPLGNKTVDLADVIDFAIENGYESFQQYRDTWNNARRQYLRKQRAGTYKGAFLDIENLTEQAGAPETYWLYYH